MFIPKSKMLALIKALNLVINCAEDKMDPPVEADLDPEEVELIKQLHDRASLAHHGDGTGLDIEVRYGNPPRGLPLPNRSMCRLCGAQLINGSCYNC